MSLKWNCSKLLDGKLSCFKIFLIW
jgi:hypothetical protein